MYPMYKEDSFREQKVGFKCENELILKTRVLFCQYDGIPLLQPNYVELARWYPQQHFQSPILHEKWPWVLSY